MLYIDNNSTDPAYNLALEQYAFDTLSQHDEIFMLWQNRDAVIIGLHQNAMEETNQGYLERYGIPVVRRLSGGGAVFHDLGNLNFTFITHECNVAKLDFVDSCRPISDALISMRLPVQLCGRNDMTIGGRKFSGNARYYRNGRLMHHGTLMFDVDIDKMSESLRVTDDKLVSKSIKSVRSRVVNLREYLHMTMDEFRACIRESIAGAMPVYILSGQDQVSTDLIKRDRYDTWEWNFGKSPEFRIVKRRRLDNFGAIRLGINVDNGIITAFSTDGDYFGVKPCDGISAALCGTRLERRALMSALDGIPLDEYYEGLSADDLVRLILE